jgi:hypothetical protein
MRPTDDRNTRGVCVNSTRWNVGYLLDPASGRVLRKVKLTDRVGTTAGLGARCLGTFVAAYVDPGGEGLVLQVRRRRFPLDGRTVATHRWRLGGLLSRLALERPGERRLVLRRFEIGETLQGLIDVAYDDLDRSSGDFLYDLQTVVNSPERRAWLLKVKDPQAGPWHAR